MKHLLTEKLIIYPILNKTWALFNITSINLVTSLWFSIQTLNVTFTI